MKSALASAGLIALSCVGCATVPVTRIAEGPVPARLRTLDAQVLEEARQFEQLLEQRGAVYENPALARYLQTIADRLLAAYPPTVRSGIRYRVVRDVSLNAYALAHGTIFLTTGMLARLENADQLALVMSHELSHVLNRDMLAFTQDLHHKAVSAKLTGLLFFGMGEGVAGRIAQTALSGYAQEHERRADAESFVAVRRAGYDLQQAAHALHLLMEDETAYRQPREWAFLRDHPATEQRLAVVRTELQLPAGAALAPSQPQPAYHAVTEPLRDANVVLHQRLREYMHAVAVAEDLVRRHPADARALCALGDTYRLMAEDPDAVEEELSPAAWRQHAGDQSRAALVAHWRRNARHSYRQALAIDADAPEAYRGLGLLASAEQAREDAVRYLKGYLQRRPQAPDHRFILRHLQRLRNAEDHAP